MPGIDSYSLDNYGLDGPSFVYPDYATGSFTAGSNFQDFTMDDGFPLNFRGFIVTGLSFRPKKIVVRNTNKQLAFLAYDSATASGVPNADGTSFSLALYGLVYSGRDFRMMRIREYSGNPMANTYGYVTPSSFNLPCPGLNTDVMIWEAFG
ncbi:hypothetical protein MHB43_10410 [Paenibacillus sp. FSL H8-0317]|uniref:hypothetical protein n=1 Tax=Paenibacillus sp. FSL H8-0317 TaxID=2921385 RepID=UPI003253B2F9